MCIHRIGLIDLPQPNLIATATAPKEVDGFMTNSVCDFQNLAAMLLV